MRSRRTVARHEFQQRLAMRKIKPATPRHQELAARRRHRIIDRDAGAPLHQHLGRHQPGGTGADDGDLSFKHSRSGMTASFYNLTPAIAAACSTYFWVCWNAPSSAFAFLMSLISAKCAATASGVQSDGGRLMPSVSRILITAKEPAPAPMMVRVGASSPSRYSTAGVIASGFNSASACGGSNSSVILVAAVGEIVLTRMLFLRPSSANTFISPTMPAFAAP